MGFFRRYGAFDLVVNLFTSLGYFDDPADDLRVLGNIHASLSEGGVVVFELMGKEVLTRIFRERDWSEKDGHLLLEERIPRSSWGWMDNRWILIAPDGGRRELSFGHRLWSATELTELLRSAGFSDVATYGSLSGAEYGPTAMRLVAVARKVQL